MAPAALPQSEVKRLWTYAEMLAELPETNQPVELWDGELVMSPTPTPSHQTIEVFALTDGSYQLYGKAADARTARSKLLSGFGISFSELQL